MRHRANLSEIMDDLSRPESEFDEAYRELEIINRRLGGIRAIERFLPNSNLLMLDVAAGACDVSEALLGRRPARIVVLDVNPRGLRFARIPAARIVAGRRPRRSTGARVSELSFPSRIGRGEMRMHDVIVIGGSLAGAVCVRELERMGIDAIALERDRFPRSKVCGGFISPGAVKYFEQLGLGNEIREAGAVEGSSARVRTGAVGGGSPFGLSGLGSLRRTLDARVARGAWV